MAHTAKKRSGIRGFIVLTLIVAVLGGYLWSQGDLISPVETTSLLINVSSSDAGFAMVGERGAPPDTTVSDTATTAAETTADTSVDAEVQAETTTTDAADVSITSETATTGTLTMDEFVAQLAAAGVDVDAVTASMSAEGRSLDNLLAVVNSGRTTVADLALRLSGQTVVRDTGSTEDTAVTVPEGGEAGSTSLFDLRWDEIGSVAYNLWFILAVTIVVIVVGRPIGWVINRLKRTPARA
ncbi:MAG: hypothetical protein IPO91_13560 [Chloroflexi bacterium]|nr:hypothetical protein [Chloroflexota bacterium]